MPVATPVRQFNRFRSVVMGGDTPVPVQLSTAEATFKQLCADFKVSEAVEKACGTAQWSCLDEFRFAFVKEEDTLPWIKAIPSIGDTNEIQLQATRTRRMWHAVRQYLASRDGVKSVVPTVDLDDLLDESELRAS